MHPGQSLDRLDFHYQPSFDQNIDAESGIEVMAVKSQRHWNLPFGSPSGDFQPSSKNGFVNRLEQTRAQITVNANRSIYDR